MKVVRAIPGMGAFPPLLVYRCAGCNHVETKEQERR
jgi:hypothetical protein